MLTSMMGALLALSAADCPSDVAASVDLAEIAERSGASEAHALEVADALTALSFDGVQPTNSTEMFLWYRQHAVNPTADCLLLLVAQEQYVRNWLSAVSRPDSSVQPTDQQRAMMVLMMSALDRRNREWLRPVVERQGWFLNSEYGPGAASAAFLIVQHADHDLDFQREMLTLLEPIAAAGEMRASSYAMLTDRVAVNSGEPQLYGSQGRCVGPGKWEARAYTGTFEEMDARREGVGLEHHAAYVSRISERCTQDQRY
ncbi:DUF6624 domain-containing protein [Hyphobacterium sp.]|jgi:hypothetical protein|uniref:DUF6624 domain-containing protein n=1 Tax=Hyphobacterium sp. TaxID=2004662 RepID=UPI003BABF76A